MVNSVIMESFTVRLKNDIQRRIIIPADIWQKLELQKWDSVKIMIERIEKIKEKQ